MIIDTKQKIKISVKQDMRNLYFPEFLHSFTGTIFDIDDVHIWVIGETKSIDGLMHTSGPHRYVRDDVNVLYINAE